ncbi:hypothetical protein [Devosia sp.]|uniref:hypothetical protein n=1 Tax=Devosia sp. TaxID=1871048 RepID=UPI001AC3FFEB|nr:hypothetical protein [Devosia sp.]MBN9335394.1 hypothetical protein [Devosia sp.]
MRFPNSAPEIASEEKAQVSKEIKLQQEVAGEAITSVNSGGCARAKILAPDHWAIVDLLHRSFPLRAVS